VRGVRAYRIAYDGRPFNGFQRQPDVPTVEDSLFDALRALDVFDGAKPPQYAAAGRTDAGVSAVAQTVAFDAPEWLSPAAFNSELPGSVRAWASADPPEDFHATHHATEREYTYSLYAPEFDERRVRRALDLLAGEHDFHNLTPDGRGTRRTLGTGLVRNGRFLSARFRAGGFPRQLVRRAATLVMSVGRGAAGLDRVERALAAEPLLGPEGIGPAPADPLVLTRVSYDISFNTDDQAAERAREVFHRKQVDRATRARVAEQIVESL
jgi:tRNA pseudouridine38-40 synthase